MTNTLHLAAPSARATMRELVAPFDPVASVYCSVAMPEQVGAEHDRHARWHPLADSLRADGADDSLIAVIGERVLRAPAMQGAVAVFATDAGHVEEHLLHEALLTDRASWRAPADVVPLLQWRQEHPAHVLAVVDRSGAELTVVRGPGQHPVTRTVDGPDDEIAIRAPGGWAGLNHNRFEHRARDSWRHNAGAVAKAIVQEMQACDGEVLLLSGDVRAVHDVVEQLPPTRSWVLRRMTGGRSPDGSAAHRPERIAAELHAAAREADAQLVAAAHEMLGPSGRAVQGWPEVVSLLAVDQVALLVLTAAPTSSREVWFGAAGTDIHLDRPRGTAGAVRRGRATAAAVRAALLSGAWVRVVDDTTFAEGVAAIRRM